jgi:hypothetical protein
MAKCQTADFGNFRQFMQKNFKTSEELRQSCKWMFAIIKVQTDKHNKIIDFSFINDPPNDIRNLNFMIGYQFPKSIKINKHPIVFYFAMDNTETCTPKPSDLHYNPNDVINQLLNTIDLIKLKDPKTIFIPSPIYIYLFPTVR